MKYMRLRCCQIPYFRGGDLTADFAPVVGNLTPRFVKSPVFPHPPGWGVGHEIDKCMLVWGLRHVFIRSN